MSDGNNFNTMFQKMNFTKHKQAQRNDIDTSEVLCQQKYKSLTSSFGRFYFDPSKMLTSSCTLSELQKYVGIVRKTGRDWVQEGSFFSYSSHLTVFSLFCRDKTKVWGTSYLWVMFVLYV